MRKPFTLVVCLLVFGAAGLSAGVKVIGWNDLGMHCMDADYSVFSILPPYNNPHAQVIDANGKLVTGTGTYHLTYEGVADPSGSINTTSQGKTNFWTFAQALFGVTLAPDMGLGGNAMPGSSNTPQTLGFEATFNWFLAKGVPFTPWDDALMKNPYPMVKLSVRDSSNAIVATTSIVLPVSDEMTCKACHSSGSSPAAQPSSGWVFDPDPERDYRLNILKLHDQHRLGSPTFAAALAAAGYSASGLYANVTSAGKPILCDICHPSNALPVSVAVGVPPLTASVHSYHAQVTDPATGTTLESNTNRSACYRCHPGSVTRCLRGAMGSAVASDGSYLIQCQDCHGPMSAVGALARQGWFQEPVCQNCHTGTASHNNGQIRYTSAFDTNGQPRVAVDSTFATDADTPASGISLYRFSSGHGGLQCEACHNSTHAELPSAYTNDNVQSVAMQGHKGMLSECSLCHGTNPTTVTGGPHGMHPVGSSWVTDHTSASDDNTAQCQVCHGTDYRGTVLSRTFADRSLNGINAWKGFQISCYACHNGPGGDGDPPAAPATVSNTSSSTFSGTPVSIYLNASDPGGHSLTLRIVSQPSHGRAGLSERSAVYIPDADFTGSDSFTFAAWNGYFDSNLGTVTITVSGAPCTVTCSASVPAQTVSGASLAFAGSAQASNCTDILTYDWNFGDGTTHASTAETSHTYGSNGTYQWIFTARSGQISCSKSGTIVVGNLPPNMKMLFLVHTPGDQGAQWRSALTLTNLDASPATIIASYSSTAGTATQGLTLSPNAVLHSEDAAQLFFFVQGDSYGVVQVWSDTALNVSIRIYNQGTNGTFGQSFYGIGTADAGSAGLVPDLRNSTQFRSNVGFLNPGASEASVSVSLHDDTGAQAGSTVTQAVPPYGWVQLNNIFSQAQASDKISGNVKVQASGSKIWAYGSVVDNGTNDPTSLPMILIAP